MFSKSNKEYGRKPYLFDSYDDMMRTQSELQATSSGKSFKHSEMKKPYLADNYEQMERMYSPSQPSPYGFWQNYELWESDGMSDEDFNKMLNNWLNGKEIPPIKNLPCNCPSCLAHSPIPSEVCCGGASSVSTSFYIIGTRRTSLPVNSEPGFNDSADVTVGGMPLPAGCGEGSSSCVTNLITLHFDCTGEWTVRQAALSICGETHTINISKDCGGGGGCPCDALTITDADGSPATDTILTGGSNDYAATGCCGIISWQVSGTGASQNGEGRLSASATACGSLSIKATCESCGTSATQYVRVTDAGTWVWIGETSCAWYPPPDEDRQYCISGQDGNCWGGVNEERIIGKIRHVTTYCMIYSDDLPYINYCYIFGTVTALTESPDYKVPTPYQPPYYYCITDTYYQEEWRCP